MRLVLSVATGDQNLDVLVECAPGALVRDLASGLATVAPHVTPRGRGHLGVVQVGPGAGPAPALWFQGRALDPDQPVADSPVRHGAVLGIGADAGGEWAEPTGVVEVRISSGRGAGRVHRLAAGRHVVGSGPSASILLEDGPAHAVVLEIGIDAGVTVHPDDAASGSVAPPSRRKPLDGPIVLPGDPEPGPAGRTYAARLARATSARGALREVDPESDRPVVHLDRAPLDGPTPWSPGAALVVGDTMLELSAVTAPDASLSPGRGGATLDYNRPPRILPPRRTTDFRLPAEPQRPDAVRFPVVMLLAPVALGAGTFLIFHNPSFLLLMLLSPVMAVANWAGNRRSRRGQHVDAVRSWAERSARVTAAAYAALGEESSARRHDLPDPATVLLAATGPRVRLWERRRTDPDWLLGRIGTADLPSEVRLIDPARLDHERDLRWTAPDVPVAVPLADVGVTGIAGPAEERTRLAGWVVAQVAAEHSPADVSVVLLGDGAGQGWHWLRWLPHVRRETGALASVGTDDETTQRRVAELLDLVERRRAAEREGRTAVAPAPVVVVLDGARRIRLLQGLVTLLRDGPGVGVLFVCLDEDERQLPEECRAVVTLGSTASVTVAGRDPVDGIRPDLPDPAWFERLGRALAPLRDISTEDLGQTLPTASRLLEVLRMDPPSGAAVVARWAGGGRTTRAVIGETGEGPFEVDLRGDGPHGLVAGTTGSGKSELLQTLIASLAVANRPDEMTFVLIDYKGGAAFKDCDRLPHTVGMVTDLDAHLTSRALESLRAELRRREHQLARLGAKDIEDYVAMRGAADAPMPRLLIVIDEFAALVSELPDFVTGLVDVARRGRSLGVHLLLATQRPAGVVSAEIRSNTNLRIALRVTDKQDSQDVIEVPDAAEIPQGLPGRAYARLGHQNLVPFQASRVGGRPPGADPGDAVRVLPLTWRSLGRPAVVVGAVDEKDVDVPTDLASLVRAVEAACLDVGVTAPPPPWLPALPDVVVELPAVDGPLLLPYGLVDLPAQQARDLAVLDLETCGSLAVVGSARSGRSTVLRALAAAVAERTSPRDVHLYGVDCGNNALLPLVGLPHTGAVVPRDQPDRLARLSRRLRAEISRRQQLLAELACADVTEQRARATEGDRLPYLLVLLDRWEGFLQAFEEYDGGALVETWTQILQEGPGAGVKVVVSGDRSLLAGRVSTLTEDRVMLRMNDRSEYGAVGLLPREVPERVPDGRAFRGPDAEELQVRVLDADVQGAAQVAALQSLGRLAEQRWAAERVDLPPSADQVPFRVDVLPARITLAEAGRLGGPPLGGTAVPAGVGGDALRLMGLDAEEHGPGVLVVGPRRSGRSTTLATMARSALDRGWAVGLVTPRRSPLQDLERERGVVGVLDLDSPKDAVGAVLSRLAPDSRPTLLLVDDLELVGTDGPLADAVVNHLGAVRDRPGLVVAAGSVDDLSGAYRGPVPALKRSRCGLFLSPSTPNEGDVLGVRLPRSALGATVPGRGVLVAAGAMHLVQVPLPTGASS
ncbi:FtsK/SpoIIIE domain-containing protein [Actinotalea sp. M2MS4P-6]|uniref:FtsK/SpoIIIE domain-containing protein n=1 Tax=Actinotalea sp. M2MS4P-6 TaxID=2983762 RepID=UPI0021E43676|nr:FtsK/SpoIIIE domain-containing protein [Actinotalea sp. M2MS4P-6]MCV2394553.1 FtsK/SpoIIIE domain-containing protein [Actinotalea sp. M2MS4P-6]